MKALLDSVHESGGVEGVLFTWLAGDLYFFWIDCSVVSESGEFRTVVFVADLLLLVPLLFLYPSLGSGGVLCLRGCVEHSLAGKSDMEHPK